MHVLATAGAVLLPVVVLASCSGQPNDLRDQRYYQEAGARDSAAASPAAAQPAGTVPTAATAAATTSLAAPATPALDRVALTAGDLAEEGVQQTGTASRAVLAELPDCAAPLGTATAGYQTTWAYPTGSTLRQYVAAYTGGPVDADDVVAALPGELDCGKYRADGGEVRVSAPTKAADGQVSWCATGSKQATCTVVRSGGPLLSVVVVTAANETKAKQAVTRIAPRAATALTRNS